MSAGPKESETRSVYRRMAPGRAGVKPVLFMAALSAARRHPKLNACHQRLIAKAKPKRLALAAVARNSPSSQTPKSEPSIRPNN